MARALLLTDEPILAKGFSALLSGVPEFDLVGVCYNPAQLIDSLSLSQPDLLLIDVNAHVTLDLIPQVRQRVSECKIILCVHSISLELAYQTMRLGIHGIFRKTLRTDVMIRCLQKVSEGEFWFEEAITAGVTQARAVQLSKRESELISLLAQGLKNKEIAHALSISEGTIKVYLSRLFRKVGVKDRYELALYGLRNEMPHLVSSGADHPLRKEPGVEPMRKPPSLLVPAMATGTFGKA